MKLPGGMRSGQSMIEYILVFAALLGVAFASTWFLTATKHSVVRTERLVGSDYP